MNIRLRLTLWYTAILCLILAIFSTAVYIGLTRNLFVILDNHLQREVGAIIGNLKIEHSHEEGEEDAEKVGDDHKIRSGEADIELSYTPEEGVFWRLMDETGQPFVDPGYFEGASIDPTAITAGQTRFGYATLANGTPIRLYTAPFVIEQQGKGVVQVAESYAHIQEVQRQLLLLLALGLPSTPSTVLRERPARSVPMICTSGSISSCPTTKWGDWQPRSTRCWPVWKMPLNGKNASLPMPRTRCVPR
jgi:hypothetical protein